MVRIRLERIDVSNFYWPFFKLRGKLNLLNLPNNFSIVTPITTIRPDPDVPVVLPSHLISLCSTRALSKSFLLTFLICLFSVQKKKKKNRVCSEITSPLEPFQKRKKIVTTDVSTSHKPSTPLVPCGILPTSFLMAKSLLFLLSVLLLLLLSAASVSAHGGDHDADGDADSGDGDSPNLRSKSLILVKVWCLILIFVGTFIGGVSPYFFKWNEGFLVLGTQFAGGVFLGTALMHFLSDANETFHDLSDKDYPFAFMLASAGYVITMLADCVISMVVARGRSIRDVEGGEANVYGGELLKISFTFFFFFWVVRGVLVFLFIYLCWQDLLCIQIRNWCFRVARYPEERKTSSFSIFKKNGGEILRTLFFAFPILLGDIEDVSGKQSFWNISGRNFLNLTLFPLTRFFCEAKKKKKKKEGQFYHLDVFNLWQCSPFNIYQFSLQ